MEPEMAPMGDAPEMDEEMKMKAECLDELMGVIDDFRAGRLKKPEEMTEKPKVEIEMG